MMGCSGRGELFRPPSKISRCERVARDLVDNRPVCGIDVNRPPAPIRHLQKNTRRPSGFRENTRKTTALIPVLIQQNQEGVTALPQLLERFSGCARRRAACCGLPRRASCATHPSSSEVVASSMISIVPSVVCGDSGAGIKPPNDGNFVPGICTTFAPTTLQNLDKKTAEPCPAVLKPVNRRMNLQHSHIEHARQLGERQRRGADQGCNQRREAMIGATLAARGAFGGLLG